MTVLGRTRFPWEFVAAAGAIYAASLWIAALLGTLDDPGPVAAGLTADLTLVVPGLYWLTCVRVRRWPAVSVVPVFLVCVLAASWILPEAHRETLRIVRYALAPLELVLLGYVAWRARRACRVYRTERYRDDRGTESDAAGREERGDAVDAIRAATLELVGQPAAARLVAYEISILYLALFGWRERAVRDDAHRFTCYRESSYGLLLAALSIVMTIELVGVHVGLRLWLGPTTAWITSILTLYGGLWLLGDYQALRRRPIVVEAERLRLRFGLRWEVDIPLAQIRSVGPVPPGERDGLKLALVGEPNVALELHEELSVSGIYGLRRRARRILIGVDSADRFRRLLAARIVQPE